MQGMLLKLLTYAGNISQLILFEHTNHIIVLFQSTRISTYLTSSNTLKYRGSRFGHEITFLTTDNKKLVISNDTSPDSNKKGPCKNFSYLTVPI
jgi:hypothetical protein